MNELPENVMAAYEICKDDSNRRPNTYWKVLFDYYNSQPRHTHLEVCCRSCYTEVLSYIAGIKVVAQ